MQRRLPTYYLDRAQKNLSILRSFGDDITQAVLDGHERVGFQNPNGINRGIYPADEVIEAARKNKLGIIGMAETNCAWNDDLRIAVKAALKQRFGNEVTSFASSHLKNKGYLPGGVLQIVKGNSAGRHLKSGSDKYGQFT